MPEEVTDKIRKEHREFFIPGSNSERSLYGSEFEIQLRNQMNQRAVARKCVEWIGNKVRFKFNRTLAAMQPCIHTTGRKDAVYIGVNGLTTVDQGYQKSDAISRFSHCIEETEQAAIYLNLFNQIWNSSDKVEDVTDAIIENIESVYHENSPERVYFLILYNIFREFLEDVDQDALPNDLTGHQESLV